MFHCHVSSLGNPQRLPGSTLSEVVRVETDSLGIPQTPISARSESQSLCPASLAPASDGDRRLVADWLSTAELPAVLCRAPEFLCDEEPPLGPASVRCNVEGV